MPPRNDDGLIRLGVLALPLAGLLALAGLYSTFKLGSGGILASGDNRAIVSTGYFVSQLVGNALALTLLIFGVVALFAYLASGGQRALASGAMVSSICGISLNLTGLGVYAYAIPALSRSYLSGKPESIRILDYIFAGPLGTILTVIFLLYSAGFILFGVAIWRSGVLADLRTIFGGGLGRWGVVGRRGRWVDALSVLREPLARMESEAEPRVRQARACEAFPGS